ncbi:MAG: AEC family transporter [Ruminococcaceae bacterium]|nr:AEC family transporter [Oscillospiraceae bacterium]
MEAFSFAFNAVAPIVIMAAIGYLLKKSGIIGKDFAKSGNRLVFKIFLPVMLFSNVYKIENLGEINPGHVFYALPAILAVFLLAFFFSGIITKEGPKRSALIQGMFRSNYALIGIPLAGSLFGEEGISAAAVLSAFAIPLFNVLAVAEFAFFSGGKKLDFRKTLLDIIKNPLIQGVAAGFAALIIRGIFAEAGIGFRLFDIAFIEKTAEYISAMATPFSLIVLGADFEFSAVSELRKEILFGTAMRCAVVPAIGIGTAFLLFSGSFSGAQFAAIAALFSAPVAVSSVPMAQEMGGDSKLAGQLVVWTTVFSAGTIFLSSFLLKTAGIF